MKIEQGKYYIGIDPGKNGGIATIHCGELMVYESMPPTIQDIWNKIRTYQGENCVCIIEKVGGRPGQSASASFTFGNNYGWLEMALTAAEIPFQHCTPQKWQKYYQLGKSSDCASKVEWKNKLKGCAQGLFPAAKITLKTADAILIANYAYNTLR
jgi:hypothetical protein